VVGQRGMDLHCLRRQFARRSMNDAILYFRLVVRSTAQDCTRVACFYCPFRSSNTSRRSKQVDLLTIVLPQISPQSGHKL